MGMMNRESLKRLAGPVVTTLLVLVLGWPWLERYRPGVQDAVTTISSHAAGIAIGFSLTWLIYRLLDVFVWSLLERRTGNQIPRLFKDLFRALVFLTVALVLAGAVFGYPVAGIWTATGLVGLVVGFALRNTIADIFSGIAINLDQPFKIGDWIEVRPRSVEPMYGRVVEVSWRSTRLRKTNNTILILPNSLISSITLVNFSQPNTQCRFSLIYTLGFEVPVERAMRVLAAGVQAAAGVLRDPPPKVLVHKTGPAGIEYKVRYWLDVTRTSPREGRHQVSRKIIAQLHLAGITPAYPKQDVFLSQMPSRQLTLQQDRTAILQRIELFGPLGAEEIDALAEHIYQRDYQAGAVIVRQGEPGSSLFIVVEGYLRAYADDLRIEEDAEVGQIEAGEFFGEMSLLTGESRNATVVAATDAICYELGKDALADLLAQRPDLAVHMSGVVARRRAALDAYHAPQPTGSNTEQIRRSLAEQLLGRMRAFFGGLHF